VKHDSEPARRAKAALIRYMDIAMPNGLRGQYASEVEGIVDDIIDAAVITARHDDRGDPAGSGGSSAP
jgi:hypothetical protein